MASAALAAASAASPPLSFSVIRARAQRLIFILDRQDAVADGEAVERQRHDAARAFVRHHLEMIGFAADDDAERDEGVVAPALAGERRSRPGTSRAPGTVIVSWTCPAASIAARAPFDQQVVEMIVEARFDDEDLRHVVQASTGAMGRSPTIERP
jgi:hypothetical protein